MATKKETKPRDENNRTVQKSEKMVITRGRGTPNEVKIQTNVTRYYCDIRKIWFTVPTGDDNDD